MTTPTDTPAYLAIMWALGWIHSSSDDVPAERFDPGFLGQVTPERLATARASWREKLGDLQVKDVVSDDPCRALAHVLAADGTAWRVGIAMSRGDEPSISSIWASPAPAREPATQTLDTARLHLRPFRADDLDDFVRLSADPDVMRYVGPGEADGPERAATVFEWLRSHWERHGYGNWALIERDTGTFIGRGGLNVLGNAGDIEVAYVIDKPYWGRGFATEVARAAIAWGFDELGLERIVGITYPDNVASQRVLLKAGLEPQPDMQLMGMSFRAFAIERSKARPS